MAAERDEHYRTPEFHDGMEAFIALFGVDKNPHPEESPEHARWLAGWQYAKKEGLYDSEGDYPW